MPPVSSQTPAYVTASTRRAGASECPEVILAIAADTRQGQLYPFLKYLSILFLKPSAQEIQQALRAICASPHVSLEMAAFPTI